MEYFCLVKVNISFYEKNWFQVSWKTKESKINKIKVPCFNSTKFFINNLKSVKILIKD